MLRILRNAAAGKLGSWASRQLAIEILGSALATIILTTAFSGLREEPSPPHNSLQSRLPSVSSETLERAAFLPGGESAPAPIRLADTSIGLFARVLVSYRDPVVPEPLPSNGGADSSTAQAKIEGEGPQTQLAGVRSQPAIVAAKPTNVRAAAARPSRLDTTRPAEPSRGGPDSSEEEFSVLGIEPVRLLSMLKPSEVLSSGQAIVHKATALSVAVLDRLTP